MCPGNPLWEGPGKSVDAIVQAGGGTAKTSATTGVQDYRQHGNQSPRGVRRDSVSRYFHLKQSV